MIPSGAIGSQIPDFLSDGNKKFCIFPADTCQNRLLTNAKVQTILFYLFIYIYLILTLLILLILLILLTLLTLLILIILIILIIL